MRRGASIVLSHCEPVPAIQLALVTPSVGYVGYGSLTQGAESSPTGWTEYRVTRLDDSVPPVHGMLRDAVSQSGRKIFFDVGGQMVLAAELNIRASYLTIDGTSAPDPGFAIFQPGVLGTSIEGAPTTGTSDIIIKGIRNIGNAAFFNYVSQNEGDIWGFTGSPGPVRRIIVDHCTFISSTDGICDRFGDTADITVSNCILSGNDSCTNSVPKKTFELLQGRDNETWYRNVWTHNGDRQIRMRYLNRNIDFVNNIIFGWQWHNTAPHSMSIVGDPGITDIKMNIENCLFECPQIPAGQVRRDIIPPYNHTSSVPSEARCLLSSPDPADGRKLFLNANIFPPGAWAAPTLEGTPPTSNSARWVPPSYAEVVHLPAGALKESILPDVGWPFRAQPEQDLLDEIQNYIGDPPP